MVSPFRAGEHRAFLVLRCAGMKAIGFIDGLVSGEAEDPSAPLFQLLMTPLRSLVKIASPGLSIIAASLRALQFRGPLRGRIAEHQDDPSHLSASVADRRRAVFNGCSVP
jgi:hypothetical protein